MADLKIDINTVATPQGLANLNEYLAFHSFVAGVKAPSTDDLAVFKKLGQSPDPAKFAHAARWYRHVATWAQRPPANLAKGSFPVAEQKSDDIDLFGDDDEEEDDAMKKKMEAMKASKGKKREAAKSSLVIHIEPASVDTDLDEVLRLVKEIKIEGVTWGAASAKIPLAYGIQKLQVSCTILDDLVNTNEITELIEELGLTEQQKEERRRKQEEGGDEDEDYEEGEEDEEPTANLRGADRLTYDALHRVLRSGKHEARIVSLDRLAHHLRVDPVRHLPRQGGVAEQTVEEHKAVVHRLLAHVVRPRRGPRACRGARASQRPLTCRNEDPAAFDAHHRRGVHLHQPVKGPAKALVGDYHVVDSAARHKAAAAGADLRLQLLSAKVRVGPAEERVLYMRRVHLHVGDLPLHAAVPLAHLDPDFLPRHRLAVPPHDQPLQQVPHVLVVGEVVDVRRVLGYDRALVRRVAACPGGRLVEGRVHNRVPLPRPRRVGRALFPHERLRPRAGEPDHVLLGRQAGPSTRPLTRRGRVAPKDRVPPLKVRQAQRPDRPLRVRVESHDPQLLARRLRRRHQCSRLEEGAVAACTT
ncbi:EF-1 guanine nucleotide exchange domain-containing protein [Babesia caballi]|uniref:EF-1 guanine nucleotide exchange domain-containing protein n=1 Tax=Babesia caballi TaxID=5871 RepID=A0AAV4M0C8_BABCB|nr:EF-1 guanine nucleotide exchange domain-containing protein [Babesia caballi]